MQLIDHRPWFRACRLISPMGFAGLCQHQSPFHKGEFEPSWYEGISYASKVFVLRSHLQEFFTWLPEDTPPFVLVTSNFDAPVHPVMQYKILHTQKVLRWYACNLMKSIEPEVIFPLPLGLPLHRQADPKR